MYGKHYHVMREVCLPYGSIIHCTENQSERHGYGLKPKGPQGWFEVTGEVLFYRGESLFCLEEPDAVTLHALEPWQPWPKPLPCSLIAGPETYYVIGQLTVLPGTVLRLGHEETQRHSSSLKSLAEGWCEATREIWLPIGTALQFRERPEHYLKDLHPLRDSQPEQGKPLAPNHACPDALSLAQQQAWLALQDQATLTMKTYQALCPTVSRRSLQRALEDLVGRGLIKAEGRRMKRCYRLATS